MILLTETTKAWLRQGCWRIAPAGLPWIQEGHRFTVHEDSQIRAYANLTTPRIKK